MLHHGFDKIKGEPYFSYGLHGKKYHYPSGNVRLMHAAKTKALKAAQKHAVTGSALDGGRRRRSRRSRSRKSPRKTSIGGRRRKSHCRSRSPRRGSRRMGASLVGGKRRRSRRGSRTSRRRAHRVPRMYI